MDPFRGQHISSVLLSTTQPPLRVYSLYRIVLPVKRIDLVFGPATLQADHLPGACTMRFPRQTWLAPGNLSSSCPGAAFWRPGLFLARCDYFRFLYHPQDVGSCTTGLCPLYPFLSTHLVVSTAESLDCARDKPYPECDAFPRHAHRRESVAVTEPQRHYTASRGPAY